jgi:hypothetical protein
VGRHDESDTLEIMNRLTELLETMRSDLHSMVEEFIAIKGGVVDEQESADSQAPSTMPLAPPPSGVSA